MKNNVTNKFVRQLSLIIVLIGLLVFMGSIYQAAAQSPPETGSTDLPNPTPGPVVDVRTKLQPYQLSGSEPSQAESRLIQEAPLLSTMPEAPIIALAQQTFLATADATVLQGYPTLNAGNTSDMWAGYDDQLNPDGQIVRSLVKFNNPPPAEREVLGGPPEGGTGVGKPRWG